VFISTFLGCYHVVVCLDVHLDSFIALSCCRFTFQTPSSTTPTVLEHHRLLPQSTSIPSLSNVPTSPPPPLHINNTNQDLIPRRSAITTALVEKAVGCPYLASPLVSSCHLVPLLYSVHKAASSFLLLPLRWS
jgi:hypothetical protein